MNVEQALKFGYQLLSNESANIDCQVLLAEVLKKNRTWLKTWPDFEIPPQSLAQYRDWLERRKAGEPVAYITGHREFWDLDLATDPSTLIPRPETELLVENALQFLSSFEQAKVLDLGTGTGAIALAIAKERSTDTVIAADFNPDAVALACKNAKANGLERVDIYHSDWFNNIPRQAFDLIVSNPPYVAPGDPHLTQGDLVFEPDSALIAADNGLADIRHIIKTATGFLAARGALMLEHGFEQGQAIRQIFLENGFESVRTLTDLAQLDRVTIGRLPE